MTYQIMWKDRGGFPGGLAESFDADNNKTALAEFKARAPLLRNRNLNTRLGHCAVILVTAKGAKIGPQISVGFSC